MNRLKEFPQLASFFEKGRASVEHFAFESLGEGLPKGALVEISGRTGGGKTEVVFRFLAQNPTLRVAWIEEDFTIYPCARPLNRVGLERVLFVDSPPGQALWTAHQILRSQVFGVLVLKASCVSEMELRRLQRAAGKSQVTVILLSQEPAKRGTWPISVQLEVWRSPEHVESHLNVLKYKGQRS